MKDISLSSAMRATLLSMTDTSKKVNRTQERLATGKKVNTPLDNPTNFFAAQSLNNAASDINQLRDSIAEGISVIKATTAGLEGITRLLESMKGIVNAAALTTDVAEKMALSESFDETYAQLNYLVKDSGYAGTNLISNDSSDPLVVVENDLTIPLNPGGSADYVVPGKFMGSGYVMHEAPGSQTAWVPGDRGEFITGYGTTGGGSVGNLSDVSLVIRFNPQFNTNGDLNGDGLLQAGEGTEIDFQLTNTGTSTANGVGFSNAATSTGWGFAFNTGAALGNVAPGNTVITNSGSDLDLNLPAGTDGTQFSITLDFTADGVTKTMTFGPLTVGNITNGLTLQANGGAVIPAKPTVRTDSLTIYSADYDKGIFGVTFPGPPSVDKTLYAEKQGLQIYHSWVYDRFKSQTGIDAAQKDIENGISLVRMYAAAMGNSSSVVVVRNDFNRALSDIYISGSENLSLADMNEESANALMLQVRQQLEMTSLDLASKSYQSVLKVLE